VDGFLVVIACGKQKVWDRNPKAGPTVARYAYTSSIFNTSRKYAERFAERWVVLSAKYGFIDPDFVISENYNRSFYDANAISTEELTAQVSERNLAPYTTVGVLGPEAYWSRVVQALAPHRLILRHINGNVGFPPSFQSLINSLIRASVPFLEDLQISEGNVQRGID
jgi:hypothetical protein